MSNQPEGRDGLLKASLGTGQAFVSKLLSALGAVGMTADEAKFLLFDDNAELLRDCASAFAERLRQEVGFALENPPEIDYCADAGIIFLRLDSTGWTGRQWVAWLRLNGHRVTQDAMTVLLSPHFRPTPAGTVHRIGIVEKMSLPADSRRFSGISDYAKKKRGLQAAHPEIACLLQRAFSCREIREDMEFTSVVTAHEPLPETGTALLSIYTDGDPRFSGCYGAPGFEHKGLVGVAFEVPENHSAVAAIDALHSAGN